MKPEAPGWVLGVSTFEDFPRDVQSRVGPCESSGHVPLVVVQAVRSQPGVVGSPQNVPQATHEKSVVRMAALEDPR